MGYTKDFLKGQEIPTTSASGYLQGNLPLAGKYPASARRDGRTFLAKNNFWFSFPGKYFDDL
jgi:hypothetical protein